MGQHADDILNGDVDEITGEWLGDGLGFPRTMNREQNPLFGVRNFLKRKGYERSTQLEFMRTYLKSKNIIYDQIKGLEMAIEIQKDFNSFARYTVALKK